jgi:uncharacterized protein (TIGR00251 family)
MFVHLQPRASENAVAGIHGDRLKIRITAPPVDAKANVALCEFLADRLQVSRSRVHLVAGKTSRKKTVLVEGLAAGWVEELLED